MGLERDSEKPYLSFIHRNLYGFDLSFFAIVIFRDEPAHPVPLLFPYNAVYGVFKPYPCNAIFGHAEELARYQGVSERIVVYRFGLIVFAHVAFFGYSEEAQ